LKVVFLEPPERSEKSSQSRRAVKSAAVLLKKVEKICCCHLTTPQNSVYCMYETEKHSCRITESDRRFWIFPESAKWDVRGKPGADKPLC